MASVKSVRRRLADGTVKTYTYDAARYDGRAAPAAEPSGLRHLARDWQRSPDWAQLAAATRRSYLHGLGLIDDRLNGRSLLTLPQIFKMPTPKINRPTRLKVWS